MATKMVSLTVTLPREIVERLDRARTVLHRSRSELTRDALRAYLATRIPIVTPSPEEVKALEEGRRQVARGEYVILDELLKELGGTAQPRRQEGDEEWT